MKRLIEKIVLVGFVTACRLAICPTRRSPSFVKPTTDGVVRPPSAFGNHDRVATLEHGHDGVRGAEVDTDHLVCHLLPLVEMGQGAPTWRRLLPMTKGKVRAELGAP